LQIFNAHNQRGCYGRAKIGHHPELLPKRKRRRLSLNE